MRSIRFLGSSSAVAMMLAAQPAFADLTGPDVWAAYVQFYEATGAQVIGDVTTTGAETVVDGPALLYRFPFGVATMRIGVPEIRLTDQGDGTVALSYPEDFDLTVDFDVPDQGSGSGVIAISQTGYTSLASGDPDALSITYAADELTFEVKEITASGEKLDVQGKGLTRGYSGTSTITLGEDLITVTGDQDISETEIAYVIESGYGDVQSQTATYAPSSYEIDMALPAGGSSLFTLSQTLRDGAYVMMASEAEGSSTQSVSSFDGEVIYEDMISTGPATTMFRVSEDGVVVNANAGASSFQVVAADLVPFPIEGGLEAVDLVYALPLLPSEDPQDVIVQINLSELSINDELWAMIDPAAELPRDPASLNIDIAASVISDIDWLDFATLEAQLDQPLPPISLENLAINDVSVSAVGAAAQATGNFTLDMTDLETFDGFPRPEGSGLLTVSGANTLIDKLINMGLIGPEEAGMARMGMAFIARSTGSDSFETAFEVNEAGEVYVNGQRMR